MYDPSVRQSQNGSTWVGFRKYFVVKNKTIYSLQGAIKKFGVKRLNALFAENKKNKILFGGEKIGEIQDIIIDDKCDGACEEGHVFYKEKLLTENIKQGPMYKVESVYVDRLGSVAKFIGVPEEYKEVPRKVYNTILQEEVEEISKLAREKLFDLIKNREELMQYKIKKNELKSEKLELLDKISHGNDKMYTGIYRYTFKIAEDSRTFRVPSIVPAYEIAFTVKKDNISCITSNYDAETLRNGNMKIQGMLDVDGCGEEELIIEKEYGGLDEAITNLEFYKQKTDGRWNQIKKIKTRREL